MSTRYSTAAAIGVRQHDTQTFDLDGHPVMVTHVGGYSYAVALEPVDGPVGLYVGIGLDSRNEAFTVTPFYTSDDCRDRGETSYYRLLEDAIDAAAEIVLSET